MYIHQQTCISAQKTFGNIELQTLNVSEQNLLRAIEPAQPNIPPNILRRMGKAVRLGIGAALPILNEHQNLNGILIGTGNGGMEDCIKFLNQIIEYNEGTLTPTNFVQSTSNAIAGQLGLNNKNHGYNITHVHRGLSFENTMLDAFMLLKENANHQYVIGGVEEISNYNYNIEKLGLWLKQEPLSNQELYASQTPGSLHGEGAAMFLVNNNEIGAKAKLIDLGMLHSENPLEISEAIGKILSKNGMVNTDIDCLFSGYSGDVRHAKISETAEQLFSENTCIVRYKHFFGEFQTVSSMALWLACQIFESQHIPKHLLFRNNTPSKVQNALIVNSYKGSQHGIMLLCAQS